MNTTISICSVSILVALLANSASAQWTIAYRGSVELNAAGITGIEELSGVSFMNGASSGSARFVAIQDSGGQAVTFDVQLNSDASITSATAISAVTFEDDTLDLEGIAVRDSTRVLVSYEGDTATGDNIPGVAEYSLTTGERLTSYELNPVWTTPGNTRPNRGFESLTLAPNGFMWTANEEALTIDGPMSTHEQGTTVRIQELNALQTSGFSGPQWAYEVDPIHTTTNPDRSGLAEMAILPDGQLLTLERSAALALPPFENRIYVIDPSGATDISTTEFADGLIGTNYTPVTKSLLWSGQVAGAFGANLEGLTLGPQLESGNWTMLGVVDNGGGTTGNSIVSFELIPPELPGDFNHDGVYRCDDIDALVMAIVGGANDLAFDLSGDGLVDGDEQDLWLSLAGAAAGFGGPYLIGDANLDGSVDVSDFNVVNSNRFSSLRGWCGGDFNYDGVTDVSDFNLWNSHKFMTAGQGVALVPEPPAGGLFCIMALSLLKFLRSRRTIAGGRGVGCQK